MVQRRSLFQKRSRRSMQVIQLIIFLLLLLFVIGLRANVGTLTTRLLQGIGVSDDTSPETAP